MKYVTLDDGSEVTSAVWVGVGRIPKPCNDNEDDPHVWRDEEQGNTLPPTPGKRQVIGQTCVKCGYRRVMLTAAQPEENEGE